MGKLYRILIARIMIILVIILSLVALVALSPRNTRAANEDNPATATEAITTTAEVTTNVSEAFGPSKPEETASETETTVTEASSSKPKHEIALAGDVISEIQATKLERQMKKAAEAAKVEEAARIATEEKAAAKKAAEEAAKATEKAAKFAAKEATKEYITPEIYESIEELADNCSLTVDEIIYIMKTLYGEANAVSSKAERSMVVWVILNRLDTPGYGFGNSIAEICTKEYQFTGYLESNPVTDRSFEVVCDVVMRWEAEKAGAINVGRTIPKEILFFHSDNGHNAFYQYTEINRGEKIYFDRNNPLENPYEN